MRKNGFDVSFFDTNLLDSPKSIQSILHKTKPNYLVIYDDGFNYLTKMCLTNMREACFEMIKYGKNHDCVVVVCSSDSTDHYFDYIEKGADFILLGEGEITLLELLKSIEDDKSIDDLQGIVFKNDSQIQVNKKREFI